MVIPPVDRIPDLIKNQQVLGAGAMVHLLDYIARKQEAIQALAPRIGRAIRLR